MFGLLIQQSGNPADYKKTWMKQYTQPVTNITFIVSDVDLRIRSSLDVE